MMTSMEGILSTSLSISLPCSNVNLISWDIILSCLEARIVRHSFKLAHVGESFFKSDNFLQNILLPSEPLQLIVLILFIDHPPYADAKLPFIFHFCVYIDLLPAFY